MIKLTVLYGQPDAGSTVQQGFSAVPEFELIETAVSAAKSSKIAVLLVPGIGTSRELRRAAEAGIGVVRIAVHCTEADVSEQHFKVANQLGLETVGFLMLSHSQPPGSSPSRRSSWIFTGQTVCTSWTRRGRCCRLGRASGSSR